MAKKRFIKVYTQGQIDGFEVWVDGVTGVNYLRSFMGYCGGLTPLLDAEGKIVITPQAELAKLTEEK